MIIIPAIDILKGKCVMLTQGKIENEKIYSTDPVFIARMWLAKGAQRIHIIDLDGAFCGAPQNLELLKEIRKSINCTIEFGGGVRSEKVAGQLFKIGVDKVILGTMIIYNPNAAAEIIKKYGADKIIVAIDIVDNQVAIAGWKELTNVDQGELMKKIEALGIKEVVLTDVKRDGTLEGVNIEDLKKQLVLTDKLNFIISGGVGNLDDVKKIKELKNERITGIIIGKALYDEQVKYEEAAAICE